MTLRAFPKSERLCSRKAIEALFAGGNRAFSAFPLRVVYRIIPQESTPSLSSAPTKGSTPSLSSAPTKESTPSVSPVLSQVPSPSLSPQVLISVSKRHFKHAVDRNRAKRQIREAWRLNRDILSPSSGSVSDGLSVGTPPPAIDSNTLQPLALHIAFIWLADTPQPSDLVHRKMRNLLHRITEDLTPTP